MESSFLNGTVELLILSTLAEGPSYGYEICQAVLSKSGGRFELKEGSLYPALHRLEREKLLSASWSEHDGRRRKYYRLSSAGVQELSTRRSAWESFSEGVRGVLNVDSLRA